MSKRVVARATGAVVAVFLAASAMAQQPPSTPAPAEPEHDMSKMDMPMDMAMDMSGDGWHLMQDGSLYLLVNRQGGPRGGREVKAPNWWMGMASRRIARGDLVLTGMFSLDPATVGTSGYRELFQVGEALDGRSIVDRQHPHDFWMQLSASWRTTVRTTGVTLAGGLSGEPALGPVAFMHRASAGAAPLAPLGHHTFDSTHVSFGVVTVGVDRGPIAVEASVFNGREPDQRRWDFDFGRMDSVSGRLWYRPNPAWEFQVSSGRLVNPEQLHPGTEVRTTASAALLQGTDAHLTAVTLGIGMNASSETTRHAAFGEFSRAWGRTLGSLRAELVQVETAVLLGDALHDGLPGETDVVGALTLGAQRDVLNRKDVSVALGLGATIYRVPAVLHASHGTHPASFQLFIQVRPTAGAMGRMWNMRMAAPPRFAGGGMH